MATSASKVYLVRADTMVPVSVNDLPADTQLVSSSAAFTSAATSAVSSAKTAAVAAAASDKESAMGNGHLAVVNAIANGIASLAVASSGASEYALAYGPNCFCRINKVSLESRLLQTAPLPLLRHSAPDVLLSRMTVHASVCLRVVASSLSGLSSQGEN